MQGRAKGGFKRTVVAQVASFIARKARHGRSTETKFVTTIGMVATYVGTYSWVHTHMSRNVFASVGMGRAADSAAFIKAQGGKLTSRHVSASEGSHRALEAHSSYH